MMIVLELISKFEIDLEVLIINEWAAMFLFVTDIMNDAYNFVFCLGPPMYNRFWQNLNLLMTEQWVEYYYNDEKKHVFRVVLVLVSITHELTQN